MKSPEDEKGNHPEGNSSKKGQEPEKTQTEQISKADYYRATPMGVGPGNG